MSLDATITVSLGSLHLDMALQVAGGSITAILGPNGAGKTTLLRSLSGLIGIDSGRVVLDGVILDDTDAHIHLPTEQRRVGMVFQDQQLFPNMSVLENVAFGPRSRGVDRHEARNTAQSWLERVDLGGFGDRRPRELSGGQAQRVALARALAIAPALVLLDEPLSALDAGNRARLRPELRDYLRALEVPTLLVTHDLLDAQMIAGQVVVLEHGRITQTGTIDEIAADPRSPYVIELVSRL
jgi:molybdate transport system ATP-binding protein